MPALESLLLGLWQSSRRISVRNVFVFCKRRRDPHLEISADLLTASGRAFHHSSFCPGSRRIFARAGPSIFNFALNLGRVGCLFERLDYLLGRDGLVRGARRVRLAAVGMVGCGTRAGSSTDEVEIFVASAVCLPGRYRWLSLHGRDACALARLVIAQILSSNPKDLVDLTIVFRHTARTGAFRAGMARAF